MANGTSDEKVARADRIAEQSRLAQARAKQEEQATANALANLRRLQPGQEPYREEMDSVTETELKLGKDGVSAKLKNAPPWVILILTLAVLALAAFVAYLWLRR